MTATKESSDRAATELKIALDNRAFEIQLFWQRSNYFLVLMTALGVATFSSKDAVVTLVVSIFAALCSYFWFRTNLGSKFWQESWEVEVTLLAKEQKIRSFERGMPDLKRQVEESLRGGQSLESRSGLRVWIDHLTIKKYSVTYNMILLSLFTMIAWSILSINNSVKLVELYWPTHSDRSKVPPKSNPPPLARSPAPLNSSIPKVNTLQPINAAQSKR
ncbi:MAG: RipA family octameric membrane protein [Sphingomonas sp.]|uniref:RipA family octameric membrane protein n=1 Tax=Sphingomonas sp. TaxID=28214 RepID=UPI003F7EF073